MKKCPWCGREYPDDVLLCETDQQSLVPAASSVAAQASPSGESKIEAPVTVQSFLLLLARYVAAIAVSYFVSYAVFFAGMFWTIWFGMLGIILLFIASGFSGVFVGAVCLPRSSRRFGSGVLLVLGLAYYIYFVTSLDILRVENNNFPYVWVAPLAAGGVLALVLIRKKSPKALHATPASPGS